MGVCELSFMVTTNLKYPHLSSYQSSNSSPTSPARERANSSTKLPMETSSLPKSSLLSKPRSLSISKPQCSRGASFPKTPFRSFSFSLSSTRITLTLPSNPLPSQFASLSFSATALSAAGGGGGDALAGGGGGGGGDGSSGGGGVEAKSVTLEEALSQSSDVIVLYVGGMTCGGCAASVKRILESQPQVSTATVYLEKETAVVWPVEEAKTAEDWQKQLGEKLANHLSTCGFKSHLQGELEKSA